MALPQKLLLFLNVSLLISAPALSNANDFRVKGDSLLSLEGVASSLTPNRNGELTSPAGDAPLLLTSRKRQADFTAPLDVEKGVDYLFRAQVRSQDGVVIRLGSLSMAYNDQGHWQTVTGLYRPADPSREKLQIRLASLSGSGTAQAEIRQLSMIPVERPEKIARRASSGTTELVREGKASALIVIPEGSERYAALATRIRNAVKERSGVELPVMTDREATAAEYPVLTASARSQHLILLGRLGNNRAFWPAYNRFLTAVDGYYPGGDGYVLHTAANVFHTGRNHLIIGGTSDRGVERGTEAFLKILADAEADGGSLRLPWLLKTDLQGDCFAFLQADNARWEKQPEDPLLPKPEPGYGTVARWYWNAMGYYWTGWDSYRKRADHYLAQVLSEQAYTHHYIAEFFVRTFDMLDDTGILPPEQVAAVDSLFLSNFFQIMTTGDLSWMTTFAPPYGQIAIVNRHQIAPWMSDYKYAQFLTDTTLPEGGLNDLLQFRRQEKERAFDNFVAQRNNPSLPGGVLNEVYEEVNASFFRYALEREKYAEFFGSGNARKALSLERTNHLNGRLIYPSGSHDLRLPLAILTSLTRDPQLHWLWKHLPEHKHVRGYFQSRYLGSIRRYTPDANVPEELPTQWSGIGFTPNPVANSPVKATEENYYFVAIREGFERKDDYLAFNGTDGIAPSGTVVALLSDGVTWLGGGEGGGRFQSNTATATRTDEPQKDVPSGKGSRGVWNAALPTGEAIRFSEQLSGEIGWTRDAIRLRHGVFVFRDRFTAHTAGTYLLGIGWNPPGHCTPEGEGGFRLVTRDGRLDLRLLGDGFTPSRNSSGAIRAQSLRSMAKGETAVVYSVLQSSPSHQMPPLPVVMSGPDRLTLGSDREATHLAWDLSHAAGAPATAALFIETPEASGIYSGFTEEGLAKRSSFAVSDPALRTALSHAFSKPSATAPQPRQTTALRVPVRDGSKGWRKRWSYDGFLKPAAVTRFKLTPSGAIDFGETLDIAEIRAQSTAPVFQPGHLPASLLLSVNGTDWSPAGGERHWRPGIRTANYGEAHPEAQTDEAQSLPSPSPARYVKFEGGGEGIETPLFFTRSRLEARHPIRLEVEDFLGTGEPQTLVVSDVFPQFPRPLRRDDLSIALLDSKGKALFQKDLSGPVQSIRTLDRKGKGRKELFVLYASGTLEIYGFDGQLHDRADLYRLHRDFAAEYRHRATRAPAGGYVLPFAIGLWRPNAAGESRIVISRYGGFTFLNPDLSLEGVMNSSGYATPGLLAHGADFGSGEEEQVVAERLRIWQIGGSGTPVVRDPGGAQFWKQTYQLLKSIPETHISSVPLAGAPIIRFELLSGVSEKPRYILLIRGSAVSLYDAAQKRTAYEWAAQAPLHGSAILEQSPGRLRLLVATADSLLWEFDWQNGIESAPNLRARELTLPVSALHEAGRGTALISGPTGLYRYNSDGAVEKIAPGDYQTAVALPGSPDRIIAADGSGNVISFAPANQ